MSESISTVFPLDILANGYSHGFAHKTSVEPLADGGSQRIGWFPIAGRKVLSVSTEIMDPTMTQRYRDFMNSLRGQLIPFYIFLMDPLEQYLLESIGTTDGSSGQHVHTLFSQIVPTTVYVNAVSAPFTIGAAAGTYGEDDVILTGSHASSLPVTFSGTGRKRFGVRLTADGFELKYVEDTFPHQYVGSFAAVEV